MQFVVHENEMFGLSKCFLIPLKHNHRKTKINLNTIMKQPRELMAVNNSTVCQVERITLAKPLWVQPMTIIKA